MKRHRFLTPLLVIVVVLSLVLSYFLLYDLAAFGNLIGNEPTTTETVETEPVENLITDFYDNTPLGFTDVVNPQAFIYRQGDNYYHINEDETLQTIKAYFTSRPIEVSSTNPVQGRDEYEQLFSGNYIEMNFLTPLPYGVHVDILNIEDTSTASFQVDQIVIPLDDSSNVYLANSESASYIHANLNEQLTKDELNNFLSSNVENYIPVDRYIGNGAYIYLPVENITLDSQLYTLETLPENLFVTQMFPNELDFSINESDDGNTMYRNFQYNLEINRTYQRLDYVINRIDQGEPSTETEKIRDSFTTVSDYEYWQNGLAISQYENNVVTYRRHLNDIPIYTSPGLIDYGATYVHLRNDQSGDVYRYQTPMLIFNAYIHDISQSYQLESDEEIMDIFDEYGYTLNEFQSVFIGYEWQQDMEDFKKANLIPKWYFEFDNTVYSIDQLQSDSFQQIWLNASSQSEGEEV